MVQSLSEPVIHHIMELLITLDALRIPRLPAENRLSFSYALAPIKAGLRPDQSSAPVEDLPDRAFGGSTTSLVMRGVSELGRRN